MADERQPRRTAIGIGSPTVVSGKDTPNHVFIDVESKRFVDLLSDPRASKARITSLQFDDGAYQLLGWTLGPSFDRLRGVYS
jgi:hypothetical protein